VNAASTGQDPVLTSRHVLTARPEFAFKLLANFSGYADWAPFLTISPTAKGADPDRMDFSIRINQMKKPLVLSGKITDREPHSVIAWSIGARGAFQLHERFTIKRAAAGSLIIHEVAFDGLLRRVIGSPLQRLYAPVFHVLDRALVRRLGAAKRLR
jgi:hypothetical protein